MYAGLQQLRQKPIPAFESTRSVKVGYRDWPIDNTHPLYLEPLAKAGDFGIDGRNHYAHALNPPYWAAAEGAIDALLVRVSVGKMLAGVNARLKRGGLKLFLYDAWRPRAVQAYYHDVWMPSEVRRRRPDLDDAGVQAEVDRYWAAPSASPARPAPHATGGAVDVSIVFEEGASLFMGGLFDDVTAAADTNFFERETQAMSYSDDEARANRRLLYWLMMDAGFANHPNEWWHYSYGDQMWAIHNELPAAIYGLAKPAPELLPTP